MSASTVAIAANHTTPSLALGVGARRRNVAVTEKKSTNIEMVGEGGGGIGVVLSDPMSGDGVGGRDLSHTIRGEMPLDRQRDFSSLQAARKGLTNSTTTVSPRGRRKVVVPKPTPVKPMWQTVMSVLTKNLMLLLVLLGFVQMIRKLSLKSGGEVVVSTVGITKVFEGRIAEVEAFLKTTTKMMQVQVEVMDKKIESEVGGLRREVTKKVEEKGLIFENALRKLESKTEGLDKSLGEIKDGGFFTKEDFDRFSDELKKSTPEGNNKENWSLDEIRAAAKEIVEKEIERHAADGLGKIDYAVYSSGGRVVDHSEHFRFGKGGSNWLFSGKNPRRIHPDAQRVLEPSFGEPGQCLPLDSSSGFVVVRLRTTIIPEAITLDHVAKSVAYDRSTAPKDCQVSGWYQEYDSVQQAGQVPKLNKLVEFVYDLDRSNSQTFNVDPSYSGVVNTVRLDFRSNHGADYTCLYRLRVHGREPDAVAISKL